MWMLILLVLMMSFATFNSNLISLFKFFLCNHVHIIIYNSFIWNVHVDVCLSIFWLLGSLFILLFIFLQILAVAICLSLFCIMYFSCYLIRESIQIVHTDESFSTIFNFRIQSANIISNANSFALLSFVFVPWSKFPSYSFVQFN